MRTHSALPRRRRLTAIGALALAATGCTVPPRVDPGAGSDAARAVGLSAPVEFCVYNAEGGPLDEPGLRLSDGDAALSLADALRRAVTTDPALQAALARVRTAMADADQARLLPNPVLSVAVRFGDGKPQIEATLVQEFVQALQLPTRASVADNRLRQVAADAVTVALDVAAEVQERYAAAQAAAAAAPVLSARTASIDKLLALAKARLDAGEGTRADLTALQAQRAELQVEIDAAALAERQERLRLARLIGQPSSAATWTLDSWKQPDAHLPSEAAWIEAALRHRPEVQSIAWRLRALGDDEALARLLPWEGASAGADVQRDDKWFAGPSVSTPVPLLDTGDARRARLAAEIAEARHDLVLARRKVVEEVRVAYATASAGTANLARLRAELIPLQEQRRRLAEESFRAGQCDSTVVVLAESDVHLTNARAIELEHQAAVAVIRLHRSVGGAGVAQSLTTAAPSTPMPSASSMPSH